MHHSLRLLCVGLSLVTVTIARAEPLPIVDTLHVLEAVDAFLGHRSLEESIVCGGLDATFDKTSSNCQFECGNDGCGAVCEENRVPMRRWTGGCQAGEAAIYSDTGEIDTFTTSDFTGPAPVVRRRLENIGDIIQLPGRIELERTEVTTFKIDPRNPNETPIEVMNVYGMFRMPDDGELYHHFPVMLTVARGVPAQAQILRLRIFDSTHYRFTGLVTP